MSVKAWRCVLTLTSALSRFMGVIPAAFRHRRVLEQLLVVNALCMPIAETNIESAIVTPEGLLQL